MSINYLSNVLMLKRLSVTMLWKTLKLQATVFVFDKALAVWGHRGLCYEEKIIIFLINKLLAYISYSGQPVLKV